MRYSRLCTLLFSTCASFLGCKESTPVDVQATGGMGGASSQEIVRKGERGSSCDSTNDCEDGLSCIVTGACPAGLACANKSCQPSNFEILGTGKQCHVSECTTKADCCGDMPEELPAKCAARDNVCSQPSIPGCVATSCTSDATCGGGTCGGGTCSLTATSCLTTADCEEDTCDLGMGTCTLSLGGCGSDVDCTSVNSCSTTYCDCTNPEYDPTDPICSDEDCAGVCGWSCVGERCVVDTSCTLDEECPFATPFCDDSGQCVACLTNDDCEDEECVGGRCGPECEADTQCSLFEACQDNECVYVGCRTDRECVLGAAAALDGSSQDPRLSVCSIAAGIGTCVYPCEIDAQCSPTEICLGGRCEYIGCETDSECKTIAGLHDRPVPTREQPWTTTAICKEEAAAP